MLQFWEQHNCNMEFRKHNKHSLNYVEWFLSWCRWRLTEWNVAPVNSSALMWAQVEAATDKPSLSLQGLLQSSNNVIRLRKLQLSWWTLVYSSPQWSFLRNEREQLCENVFFMILKHVKISFTIAKWDILPVRTLVFPFWTLLLLFIPVQPTFLSIHQCDLKTVPARLFRVEDHSDFRVGSQEGRFHRLGMTLVHSSASTIKKRSWVTHTTEVITTISGEFLEKVCDSIPTKYILFFARRLKNLRGNDWFHIIVPEVRGVKLWSEGQI